MENKCIIHILPNGLRAVYRQRQGNVGYCGVAVNAGSRDEGDRLGLAHFVEHTIFKGTRRRRAWHILNRMETVGGELNAYTTKEETMVYSLFPDGNMARAMELIADLLKSSTFPDRELEKEREVVVEEIMSYRDSPSDTVYDDFEDLLFAGHPLGHNILGSEQSLLRLNSADCRDFLSSRYVPQNMVLFGVGSESADRFFRRAEKYFSDMHHALVAPPRVAPARVKQFDVVRKIDSHQVHSITGVQTFGMHDERKYALLLLNNLLGGPGMNSLLNVAIRERRGYAYTVESSVTLLSDCGLMSIYFGCEEHNAVRCRNLITETLESLATKGLTPRALDAAKRQYAGQLLVSCESLEGSALSMGRSVLAYDCVNTVEEVTEKIRAVSVEDLRRMAAEIAEGCSSLTLL